MTRRWQDEKIADLIPHGESMSLLDRIVEWGDDFVVCATTSHQCSNNPLKFDGKLPSLCLVEYGAQAAAVHAAIVASRVDEQGKPAYVGNFKNIQCQRDNVDNDLPEIMVRAEKEASSSAGAIYQLRASVNDTDLVTATMTLLMRG